MKGRFKLENVKVKTPEGEFEIGLIEIESEQSTEETQLQHASLAKLFELVAPALQKWLGS